MLTGDELSIQQINSTRGASAEMPCMCCMNVKSKWSLDMAHDVSGYFVSSTETDLSKIVLHSDETVRGIAKKLEARHPIETKTKFTVTQKQLGFTYSPGMITLDPALSVIYKPVSALMYDWLHCMLIDGVFAITVGETMAVLRPMGVTYGQIGTFVDKWHWPGRIGQRSVSGADAFKAAKISKWYEERRFKTSASEALSLYPVMAAFFDQEDIDRMRVPAVTCFRLCCDVLDSLQSVCRSRCTPAKLASVVLRFLSFFKLCFGESCMGPKHHYMLHIPQQYNKHNILFPCFVHERKHRECKRFASDIRNTACDFERTLLEEITNHHIMTLEKSTFSLGPQLIKPARPSPRMLEILHQSVGDVDIALGSQARFSDWGIVCKGDVVVARVGDQHRAGRVFLIAAIDNVVCIGLSVWKFLRRSKGYSVWETTGSSDVLIEADCVVNTVVWSMQGSEIEVIMPRL